MTAGLLDSVSDEDLDLDGDLGADDSRRFWVSVDPLGEDRAAANVWKVFLYVRASTAQRLSTSLVRTASRGWSALAELDLVLAEEGFQRSHPWELGTGRGFVAWVTPDIDAVLDQWKAEA